MCARLEGTPPEINKLSIDDEFIALDLRWIKQKQQFPWTLPGNSVLLFSTPDEEERTFPLHLGIVGIRFKIYSSGHPTAFLKICFEDENKLKYTGTLSLHREGKQLFDLPFNNTGFNITKSGRSRELRSKARELRLINVMVYNEAKGEHYFGEHRFVFYRPELIIDRKVMKNIPWAIR